MSRSSRLRRRLPARLAGDSASTEHSAPPDVPVPVEPPLRGTYVGNGRVLVFPETGGRLFVSSRDLSLMPELVRDGIYDVPFTRFLQRHLQPDDTFVDVGANVGLFTIAGGYLAWRGRTVAYEPAPPLLELLRDNVAANWFHDRVTIRPVAVGRASATATFSFPESLQMLGGLDVEPAAFESLRAGTSVERFPVEVVCLDDELADTGPIALVKIDVEGGEADVLAGMRGLLEAGRVRTISLEVRRDTAERNISTARWDALAAELGSLHDRGATFAVPDDDGHLDDLPLDEVLNVGLYSNLVVRLPH